MRSGVRSARRRYRHFRARVGRLSGLRFLWLEITRSCNLACTHCYAGSGPQLPMSEGMEAADWRAVLDQARALGCRKLQFIGGEPTIHPDLCTLIEHAKRVGYRYCEVFTNATDLSDELVGTMRRHRIHAAVSFYSADPGIHDRITGQPGSYQETVRGIKRLVRERIRLRAGIIRVDEDPAHLKETKKYLKRLGVKQIGDDRVRGIGRGENLVANAQPASELCGHCWRGKLCVSANGDAYPCVFSRATAVGNFFRDGITGIVESQELRAFRRARYLGEHGG